MRLVDYLDKGASLDPNAACLTTDGETRTYAMVQELTAQIAASLQARGVEPGGKVAIISGNDPDAFTTVFGISRAGAVWCPINPRNEAKENHELLEQFEVEAVIYAPAYQGLVISIADNLPRVHTWVSLGEAANREPEKFLSWQEFLATGRNSAGAEVDRAPVEDLQLLVGTGGTTGRPKGVMLTGANVEAMTALTLMSYPFNDCPVYLALAPLTHAAGVLCFPILTKGGEIVIMRSPDVEEFLRLIPKHGVTHTFLPPTVIYMVLDSQNLASTDLGSLECFWYGAAPMSTEKLKTALEKIGPVMAQLFGQTEAPMMISTMAPAEHFNPDGTVATKRLGSAGKPTPLVRVAIMAEDGQLLPRGERGEIVVRGSLVSPGYFKNPEENAKAQKYGWHHTGDIGFLNDEGFLFIVDRAKDMIITGGFNVYSTEVEQAALTHPDVQDCAVVGLPDEKWGERVVAVVQPRKGAEVDPHQIIAHVKKEVGSVKTPKEVHVWPDLPRSKVGKVVKPDIKTQLLNG